ncbi:hypothetical protein [Planobispora longispora]|uniref:Secreted protein n=1 Tax=Planobispora longispora TaxID=28887 RepID=A0A8J3RQM8_9ACTN|nr:hypothetical protein [Planobispora longispora]GIH77889.1 hypothetical protein Plo01_43180 [Planobispora longispora]
MFRLLSPRRIAVAVAGAALISTTAACGAGANASLCADAQKLFTDYSSSAPAASADLAKLNELNAKFAADLKALAGKADGDLASALGDLAKTWDGLQIDPSNPSAAISAAQELTTNLTQAAAKIEGACS